MRLPAITSGLSVLGAGWVTALGREPLTVWQRICAGERPVAGRLSGQFDGPDAPVYAVSLPEDAAAGFARLRRSSAISYFAVAAAADAMSEAALQPSARMALIMASSNGAVVYTRKFYTEVIERGSGSPILFPETVYNAPASHVAARFGIDGTALTFVGDATAGTDALAAAEEIIASGAADNCLIVAAEEADWLVWEAARCWGLAAGAGDPVVSEGAAALVVGPPGGGRPQIEAVHAGLSSNRAHPLKTGLRRVLKDLGGAGPSDLVMLSASGSKLDRAESVAVDAILTGIPCMAPKMFLGEAFSVSTLAQTICAVLAIRTGTARRVVVPVVGWSGQLGGLVIGPGRDPV